MSSSEACSSSLQSFTSASSKLNDFECGEFVFSSNFDSGNLRSVQLVKSCPETETTDNIIHAEFDLSTAPDCYGTPYENPNRTWFFFSIRGGRPFRNIKLNVRNLNRQAKLFSQGMQPVVRVGENGKWERIKDKPGYATEGDCFYISFLHHTTDMTNIPHYYAFTYPFTYTECQNLLEKFDSRYAKSQYEIDCIMNRIAGLEKVEKENPPKKVDPIKISSLKNLAKDSIISNITESDETRSTPSPPGVHLELVTCELRSSSASPPNPSGPLYETMSKRELENEIYYHRELLINSLERRRVELITISSFRGIQNEFEERLSNLFPNSDTPRCRIFKDKKIIFMSSRVHPGETVASFVLNGFMNLLLDKKSLIAATLRQMYVFKVVPFLNPDGVFNGLYRTDTLGQNLNRMYICPQIDLHPSIYAVKKLIKYYHIGYDRFDDDNKIKVTEVESPKKPTVNTPLMPVTKRIVVKKDEMCSTDSLFDFVEKLRNETSKMESADSSNPNSSSKETTSSEGEENHSQNTTENTSPSSSSDNKIFTDKLIPEIRAVAQEPLPKKTGSGIFGKKTVDSLGRKTGFKTVFSGLGGMHRNNENKLKDVQNTATVQRSKFKKVLTRKDVKGASTANVSVKGLNKKNILCYQNIDISSEHLLSDGIEKPEKSNLFLYMDFHGHASKKGIFMYGNHFQSTPEAVECMLLPRLMGINCHHFHYDACNFSERNMYRREKRDGLSKEGSGRVAVYKMTGLIKCYTLESNYNTGKYVNPIPTRSKEVNQKLPNIVPPKYTPAIFEEVGRALGASILDLTNSNSISRVYNSEYRSIQALRIALRNEVERFGSQRPPINTGRILSSQSTIKRSKRSLLSSSSSIPQNDVPKENKAHYHVPWELSVPSSSSAQNTTSSSILQALNQPKSSHKTTRLIKRNPLKAHSTNLYGKKDASMTSKKKPKPSALLESCSNTNKKEHGSFQIPPKKVRVSPTTQNLGKEVVSAIAPIVARKPPPAPAIEPSSSSSNLLFKTIIADDVLPSLEISSDLVVADIILPTIIDDDPNKGVVQIFPSNEHANSSSHHLLTAKSEQKSACSLTASASMSQFYSDAEISLLKKCTSDSGLDIYGGKCDLAMNVAGHSSFKTGTAPGTGIIDDAIPSCSTRLLVHQTVSKPPLLTFRKTKKADSFLMKVGTSPSASLASSFNPKAKKGAAGNDNMKLGKKKRMIRHDSLIMKRKKNKAKITRH